MPLQRFRSSCALAVVLVLAACNAPSPGMRPSPDGNGGAADAPLPADASNVVRPDAHGADAHSADANPAPADAGGTPGADAASPDAGRTGGGDAGSSGGDAGSSGGDAGSSGGDAGSSGSDAGSSGSDAGSSGGGGGIVSCYTEGDPGATCTLPTHCCFANYSSAHDGMCTTSACDWGTIECDGPEDCAGGQHCCEHTIVTPEGIAGHQIACQAAACGAAPANHEMCHPTTASAAGTCSSPSSRCVTALGNDSDLPPSLHICQ